MPPDSQRECFVIAAIDEPSSLIRTYADTVFEFLLKPAAEAVELSPLRADHIADPGNVTIQVLQHLADAALVVADVTYRNPNVYYELGVRHALKLPVVLIARAGEPLPADIVSERVLFLQVEGLEALRDRVVTIGQLTNAMKRALTGNAVSPLNRIGRRSEAISELGASPTEDIRDKLALILDRSDVTSLAQGIEFLRNDVRRLLDLNDRQRDEIALRSISVRDALQNEVASRATIGRNIEIALTHTDGVQLLASPFIELRDNRWDGFEALTRLIGESGSPMMPSDWLPTAEYLNLMPEIGVRALQLLGDFLTQRHSPRPPVDHWICSINASSEQLHDAAFLELASKLPAVGIQTGCQVMYEIVEGDISDARETIVPNLRNLRLAGAKICIDDFGSKYTSLTYLQRWPIDWLKIDRTLTAAIASQPDSDASLALVAATIAMTRALSFGSAAQDVENEEQHLALAQIGFDLAQGAHWTRPVKLARLGDLWSVPPHG